MTEPTPLRGSCSCGRYHYTLLIPANRADEIRLHFATDDDHRRTTSTLLTSYLRVPLHWYSSRTVPHFPDETELSISRTFTPANLPHTQRKFCGYCGTHMTYWTEEPRQEEEYLHINVGSLGGQGLATLEHIGVLDGAADGDETESSDREQGPVAGLRLHAEAGVQGQNEGGEGLPVRSTRQGRRGNLSWFEEMIDGSRLGRTSRTRKGVSHSADGMTTISWEVSEFVDGDEELDTAELPPEFSRAKRKIGEVATDDDTTME